MPRKPKPKQLPVEPPASPKIGGDIKSRVLSLLRSQDAEQQNEIVSAVLNELVQDRKKQLEDNQAKIDAAKQNLETLHNAIQQGLTTQV